MALWADVAKWLACAGLALTAAASAQQGYDPPKHTQPVPLFSDIGPERAAYFADLGLSFERDRAAHWQLAEHRRLERALASLRSQRKGVVDAYVVAISLDSDAVFGREAREAGKVLSRRYDAEGRTIVLAGTDGSGPSTLPRGSPETLALALARIAELADLKEDVLILYSTSHGAPIGIVYNDGDSGFGMISPVRLWTLLDSLGFKRNMILISACFSGIFVPPLATDDSVVLTASSSDRTSFGCQSDNDWTFFGDALINHALRKAQPIDAAAEEAARLVGEWETKGNITPSQPQVAIGGKAATWLAALDRRVPAAATAPVGKPAVASLGLP